LFHDEDFSKGCATGITPVIDPDEKSAQVAPVDKTNASTDAPKTSEIVTAAKQLELERAMRQEKYEALRRRVHMATRRVHDAATAINGMVAKVP